MTIIECNRYGNEFCITSTGHAGFAPSGKDIVCAAISILLQTLIVYTDARDYDIKEGQLWVHGKGDKAMAAYEFTLIGLHMLEVEYGDYVKVIEGCTINDSSPLV